METQIPEDWKRSVSAVLRNGRNIKVRFTTAAQPWNDAFPNSTSYELYDALREELSQPGAIGRKVENMNEPGETYTFKFFPEQKEFFAKICLCPDRNSIIIYSAHISRKGDKL
jgi:hypothetical protein